jgi:hypothetical protein
VLLDPCDAARLSREAKIHLSLAIRLMRRVMRSDGFPEIRRRIKLSQWNTVHGDRGQLGMEVGIPTRVLDAIQSHAPRTAAEGYGE